MELRYLGTAAAEGIPALFCRCENCLRARALGGKNIRTRSQALLDGKILIDYPADGYAHALRDGIQYADIHTVLITHIHEDHFYAKDFLQRRQGYAHLREDEKPLTIYGSEDLFVPFMTEVEVYQRTVPQESLYRVRLQIVNPFTPFEAEGYRITPLKAYHGTAHPYLYIVEKDGQALLYAHDTDIFFDEVWDYIAEQGFRFDIVSLDCTEGARPIRYHGHMNLERNIEVRDRLAKLGALKADAAVVLNHFSHNALSACYDDFAPIAAREGFLVSYDGMTLSV